MKQTAEEENVMKKDLRWMKIGAIIVLSLAYIGYILLMILKKASGQLIFHSISIKILCARPIPCQATFL